MSEHIPTIDDLQTVAGNQIGQIDALVAKGEFYQAEYAAVYLIITLQSIQRIIRDKERPNVFKM